MLTRFRTRGIAALLALAGLTNAAPFLGAQAPIGGIGKASPTLIADCDYTEGSCGGDPTYDEGGGYNGNGVAGSSSAVCGSGRNQECKREVVERCTKWVVQTVSLDASITGGGGTTATVCSERVTTTFIYYWS